MNQKTTEERARILQLLVEGNSLRSTCRITDCSINTVTGLLIDAGMACEAFQKDVLKNLPCKNVQVDEIWSFVYSKRKVNQPKIPGKGDVWTWVAMCSDTKIVPCWIVGERDKATAIEFISELAPRMSNKIQLISDGNGDYIAAVEEAFGIEVDYAMLIKIYDQLSKTRDKYRGIDKKLIIGFVPDKKISTSFIERQNLTMRMCMKRFARKTNAFSRKIENHKQAVNLHFMDYNFCRIHGTLRITPAMAAGISDHVWSLEEVVRLIK